MAWSAQCTSSTTSRTARSRPRWPSAPRTAANRSPRSTRSSVSGSGCGQRDGGQHVRRAAAGSAPGRCRRPRRAGPGRSAASLVSASVKGRYGGGASPRSMQCPSRQRSPPAAARLSSSASSRVLPIPASPPTTTPPACPRRAASRPADERGELGGAADDRDGGAGHRDILACSGDNLVARTAVHVAGCGQPGCVVHRRDGRGAGGAGAREGAGVRPRSSPSPQPRRRRGVPVRRWAARLAVVLLAVTSASGADDAAAGPGRAGGSRTGGAPAGGLVLYRAPVSPLSVLRAFAPPATRYGAGHLGVDLAVGPRWGRSLGGDGHGDLRRVGRRARHRRGRASRRHPHRVRTARPAVRAGRRGRDRDRCSGVVHGPRHARRAR